MIFIFDNNKIQKKYERGDTLIFLDSEIVLYDGKQNTLKGESLSQGDAILKAEKLYSSINSSDFSNDQKLWFEVIESQVILYMLSKIIRCTNLIDRIDDNFPGKKEYFTSNAIIKSLINRDKINFKQSYKAQLKSIIIEKFPQFFWTFKIARMHGFKNHTKNKISSNYDLLIHGENKAYQKICDDISLSLKKDIKVALLTSTNETNSRHFNIEKLIGEHFFKHVAEVNRELKLFFKILASKLVSKIDFGNIKIRKNQSKLIYKELFNWYIPELSKIYIISKDIIRKLNPKMIIINDLADIKSRMLAILSKINKIEIIYQQFGLQGYFDIQLKRNHANKYFLWGKIHKSVFMEHGVPESQIVITGSPAIRLRKRGYTSKVTKGNKRSKMVILFPLIPSSPLTFGNGGNHTTFQCRQILNTIMECVSNNKESYDLLIKPRPLLDNEWATDIIKDVSPYFKVLSHSIPIEDIFDDVDLMITSHSTVGLDALIRNIPIIIFDPYTHPSKNFYTSRNVGFYAGNKTKLNNTLNKISLDQNFLKGILNSQNLQLTSMVEQAGSNSKGSLIKNIEKILKEKNND